MTDDLLGKIPASLKSLYEMENELRDAARDGLILRNEKATEHLAGARRLAGKSSAHEPFHTNKDDCLRLNSSHF